MGEPTTGTKTAVRLPLLLVPLTESLIHRLEYNMPNDDLECERLGTFRPPYRDMMRKCLLKPDLQHHLVTLTLGDRLGMAPPNDRDSKVGRVLDVGTGTGIWAVDFGDEHPESQVIGVDLSPIQPSLYG